MIASARYLGRLRVENTHLKSGDTFITDAPTDNRGQGEAFSPTDTVATALGNCILTTMGIKAIDKGIKLEGAVAQIEKIMASDPRRIAKIEIKLQFPENYSDKTKKILEHTAFNCPVYKSLHPDIEKIITFDYPMV